MRASLKKLLLVKEIISREGIVHFRRFRLLETPIFRIYLHQILQADKDKHLHDHPWSFVALILKGHYEEKLLINGSSHKLNQCKFGKIIFRKSTQFHCINNVFEPTWTLVFAHGKKREWGYQTELGWIDHKTYRSLKNVDRKNSSTSEIKNE